MLTKLQKSKRSSLSLYLGESTARGMTQSFEDGLSFEWPEFKPNEIYTSHWYQERHLTKTVLMPRNKKLNTL